MTAPPLKVARTTTTTATISPNANNNNTSVNNGIMLFGVRVMPGIESCSPTSTLSSSNYRKCMSMNNLAQYQEQQQQQLSNCGSPVAAGYGSDDSHRASISHNRERKRGRPWSEEEHKLFLMGLSEVGKGDWKGISRNFVKTRTPTQVASHAQKYFLRRTNFNRRRRRSSVFDITTDTMIRSASDSQLNRRDTTFQPKQATNQPVLFSSPRSSSFIPRSNNMEIPIQVVAPQQSTNLTNVNLNLSPTSSISIDSTIEKREFEPFLSLKLSLSSSDEESSKPSNTFGGFNGNGDNIISVA